MPKAEKRTNRQNHSADAVTAAPKTFRRRLHHRGLLAQVPIYLGKLLRGFVYRNDWKVLPMSAIIAGLVSMVVRGDCFLTMEGTMKGALALSCVGIWNGCFNAIQVVCRERPIVKREHRSGMHVISYIAAHMIYQALLCLVQTVLTLYVCKAAGVHFPEKGLMTSWMLPEMGVTIFLITYAADMLALLISCLVRSTTAAMTVMPFVLIFQLVFSGGFFTLPAWASSFSNVSISSYGLKCIAAQADYNHLPMATAWNMLNRMKNEEINLQITEGQAADLAAKITEELDPELGKTVKGLKALLPDPDKSYGYTTTIGQVVDILGPERVKNAVQQKAAAAGYVEDYEYSRGNVAVYWFMLALFSFVMAVGCVIVLSFIDKDKR